MREEGRTLVVTTQYVGEAEYCDDDEHFDEAHPPTNTLHSLSHHEDTSPGTSRRRIESSLEDLEQKPNSGEDEDGAQGEQPGPSPVRRLSLARHGDIPGLGGQGLRVRRGRRR